MSKRERTGKSAQGSYVTQKDVAELAGVSPSIVSYVINNGPRSISEGTRQRVLHAIAELKYRPNIHAQKLMRASWENELAPRQFGVIIGGPRDVFLRPYFLSIIYSVLDEAAQQALNMRFLLFYEELDNPLIFNKLIHNEEISALVLVKAGPKLWSEEGAKMMARLRERVPNVISVGRAMPGIPSVTFDLGQAIYKATSYLLDLGHRCLAYIGSTETRLAGFQQALSERKLPFDPSLVMPLYPFNNSESGYNAALSLRENGRMRGPQRITGIVAASDEAAWGIMRCIQETGLRIPQDISVISIDDDSINKFLLPALTTVSIPKEQMGRTAIHLMLQRKGHTDEPSVIINLPTELIIRESCARPIE